MKMTVDRVRDRFSRTGLFRNCSPDEVLEAIERPFVTMGARTEVLLIAKAREAEALSILRGIWQNDPKDWSFGYCSCIAETASLMLKSAIPSSNYRLLVSKKTQKKELPRKLPLKIKKHFILRWEDRCFDPLKGADCSWLHRYSMLGFRHASFLNPTNRARIRYPSANALLLLAWVIHLRGREEECRKGALFIKEIQALWKTVSHRKSIKEEILLALRELEAARP
jgi:hypothetical protein